MKYTMRGSNCWEVWWWHISTKVFFCSYSVNHDWEFWQVVKGLVPPDQLITYNYRVYLDMCIDNNMGHVIYIYQHF
jgi:hypothetical protein